jgi:hypothetical protein
VWCHGGEGRERGRKVVLEGQRGKMVKVDVGVEEEAERGKEESTYKCVCVRAFGEGVIRSAVR